MPPLTLGGMTLVPQQGSTTEPRAAPPDQSESFTTHSPISHDSGPPPVPVAELTAHYKQNSLYVAVHEPIFDEGGQITDLCLVWCNAVYASIRTQPPVNGSRVSNTYIDPAEVIELANTAWTVGSVEQDFVLKDSPRRVYRIPDQPKVLAVNWSRFGEWIVEIAEDLSTLHNTKAELEIRRLELADAQHQQQLAHLRDHLARNMHDSLIQQLFAIGIGIDAALPEVDGATAAHLTRCREHLRLTIDEIRQMVRELDAGPQSDSADSQRLEIDNVIAETSMALGFTPKFRSNLRENLNAELRYDITAVIREALANVARHAKARSATVVVDRSRTHLVVAVCDDGAGFSFTPSPANLSSHGLRNMAGRARRHDGELLVRNTHPGAEVIWRIPL